MPAPKIIFQKCVGSITDLFKGFFRALWNLNLRLLSCLFFSLPFSSSLQTKYQSSYSPKTLWTFLKHSAFWAYCPFALECLAPYLFKGKLTHPVFYSKTASGAFLNLLHLELISLILNLLYLWGIYLLLLKIWKFNEDRDLQSSIFVSSAVHWTTYI